MPSAYYTLESAKPAVTVIALRLDADLDIAAFNEINAQLIDRWPIRAGQQVVVDLTDSRYMGSVLLGLLINIRQRARAYGGDVIVAAASARLTQVFRSANLDRLIVLVPTRADALAQL